MDVKYGPWSIERGKDDTADYAEFSFQSLEISHYKDEQGEHYELRSGLHYVRLVREAV